MKIKQILSWFTTKLAVKLHPKNMKCVNILNITDIFTYRRDDEGRDYYNCLCSRRSGYPNQHISISFAYLLEEK